MTPVWAQNPASVAASSLPQSALASEMQIQLTNTDDAPVLVNSKSHDGLLVRVVDATGTGVADAAVAIRFPDSGSSAVFRGGAHSAVAYTDATGIAHLGDIEWNGLPGTVAIRITATKANSHAGILIERTLVSSLETVRSESANSPAASGSVSKKSAEQSYTFAAPSGTPSNSKAASTAVSEAASAVSVAPLRASPSPGVLAEARPPAPRPTVSITSRINGNTSLSKSVAPSSEPSVSITGGVSDRSFGRGKLKWIILTAVIAGAGAGAAMAAMGKTTSSGSTTSTAGVSIGTPSLSIGQP
jgi:hypothetical protein